LFKGIYALGLALWLAGGASAPVSGRDTIGIHPINFYQLSQGEEVFYPLAVNAFGLMDLTLPAQDLEPLFSRWADHHINTIRINVDHAGPTGKPLTSYLSRDGRLSEAALSRLDAIFTLSEKHGMYVILGLFDTQRMAEDWDVSPYNQARGGECNTLADWFTKPSLLQQALRRVEQLVKRYKPRQVLAWEIARGANVDDLNLRPNAELRNGIAYWVVRIAGALRDHDDHGHLTALSFVPNSYPTTLLNLPQVHVNFLQVQSQDVLRAAQSIPHYLQSIRDFKKPVFVAEPVWTGDRGGRETFMKYLFWASFASGSGMFLSPLKMNGLEPIGGADLHLADLLAAYRTEIRLEGVPRPIVAPLELTPKDSFLTAESLAGYDRVYWIMRKTPAKAKAQVLMRTVEGMYQFQWFDLEEEKKYPPRPFRQFRKELRMETPEFERDILGVLRYLGPLPSPPSQPGETAAPGK